jgi:hypothetical protein
MIPGFVMSKFFRPGIHNLNAMKLCVTKIVKIYEHEQTMLALQISKCHSQTSSKQIKFSECLLPFKLQLFIILLHIEICKAMHECEGMNWIQMAKDMFQWYDLKNTVKKKVV